MTENRLAIFLTLELAKSSLFGIPILSTPMGCLFIAIASVYALYLSSPKPDYYAPIGKAYALMFLDLRSLCESPSYLPFIPTGPFKA
jgi:hypothetical protein